MGGTASALLLVSLTWATGTREAHKWLIALLPIAGLVGLMYKYLGTSVEAGNNLILDEVHDPQRTIPIRMTPLILIGTFITHLFGGSAGREGTAIQTGASLADQLGKPFGMDATERRVLLMAGISAGFASVFGTPLAGALFGLDVLALGAVSYDAIAPCFIAAFIGDFTTHAWGVRHTLYRVAAFPALNAPGCCGQLSPAPPSVSSGWPLQGSLTPSDISSGITSPTLRFGPLQAAPRWLSVFSRWERHATSV